MYICKCNWVCDCVGTTADSSPEADGGLCHRQRW